MGGGRVFSSYFNRDKLNGVYMTGKTLYDKLWDSHLVTQRDDGTALIYIDRQLIHEVTSPQAFEGLRLAGRRPWRADANFATPDHNIPTTRDERSQGLEGIRDPISRIQVTTLGDNCREFGIFELDMNDERQGIVHVMATQCLMQNKMKNMLIRVDGRLNPGVTAKDIVLAIIGEIGTAGGTGYTIEFGGEAIQSLSIEGRMTVCNMAIEAGARAGLIGVDQTTLDYIKGRPFAPKGEMWEKACTAWRDMVSDDDAHFDRVVVIDAAEIIPQVTWGTSPEMVAPITGEIPDPEQQSSPSRRENMRQALKYMGLTPGMKITDIKLDCIFIGSCTNSRIEDLRAAAAVVKGHKVAATIEMALVVPGSGLVKKQAEAEGLDKIFIEAGLEWREPGCSMCLAMNADQLGAGKHCASTSNRNFEGRQGFGGRTHLVSPAMAAAAAINGHFVDVRDMLLTLDR